MDRFKRGSQGDRSSSATPKADGRLPLSFPSEGPAPYSPSEHPVTPAFGPASCSSTTNRAPASSEPEQQARSGFFSSHFSATSDKSGPLTPVGTVTGGGGGGGTSISRTQTKMSAALAPQTVTPSPHSGVASSSSLADDNGDINTDQDNSFPSRSFFSSFPESSKPPPPVSSTAPRASSDAHAATISSAPSKGGASTGKRRMLLDVDVQCGSGSGRTVGASGGGRHPSISRVPVESSSPSCLQLPEPPTIAGSTGKGKGKQCAPQQQPKKRAASQHSESGQHPAAQWPSGGGRAREGDESSAAGVRSGDGILPRVEQNERPSTTLGCPAPGRGLAGPVPTPATANAAAAAAASKGRGSSHRKSSSPSSPPLDAVMDDRDPFDDHVKAEEAASSSLAESTENVMKRQLTFREGFARAHSQLLQLDDGFTMLAQVDELLVDARALLKGMGIEPQSAEQPEAMDEDRAGYEEESRGALEQGSHDPPLFLPQGSLKPLVAPDGKNHKNDGGDFAPSLSTGVVTQPPASAARMEGEDGGGGEVYNDMDIASTE